MNPRRWCVAGALLLLSVSSLPGDDISSSQFLTKDRFGIGGDLRFGATSNLRNSTGDFPMTDVRRFFTNAWLGTGQQINIEQNAETLNYPLGGDLGIDFYFNIKQPDPALIDDFSITAVVNMNFNTSLFGTAVSTGTIGNLLYFRDLYVKLEDLFMPGLDFWVGDRRRAGLPMPISRFRPSQNDASLRGIGADIPFGPTFSLLVDFGYHWQTSQTYPIFENGAVVAQEFLGYQPLDSGGSPLTSDYYVWLDDTQSQRLRPIFSLNARAEITPGAEEGKEPPIIIGIGGTAEFIPATPGGRLNLESGATYGRPTDEGGDNALDDFPNEFGFRIGADFGLRLGDNAGLMAGLGWSRGISTSPIGITDFDFLNRLSEAQFEGIDNRSVGQQQSITLGLGFTGMYLFGGMFDLWAEAGSRLGSFFSTAENAFSLSQDRMGQAESTFIYASGRLEFTIPQTQLYIGLESSYEQELLSRNRYLELSDLYVTELNLPPLSIASPEAGDQVATVVRAFVSFGYRLDEMRGINTNKVWAVIGFSVVDTTYRILHDPNHFSNGSTAFLLWARAYVGLQSHFVF